MAKVLINAGADINFQNNDGSTPLHTAAFFCRPEIAKNYWQKELTEQERISTGSLPMKLYLVHMLLLKMPYDGLGKMLAPMELVIKYARIYQKGHSHPEMPLLYLFT